MSFKKMTPMLLAASVFLSGATGLFIGAMTPASAITSVDELTDVNADHWAYEALRDLVEKYDVIEGYPDHTFRGERNATRWELAAALNALIKAVGRDLARLGAEKADKADLQTLARLQEQFRNELAALQARTNALEARATAIEAKNEEQDTRLSLLEKTQLHGDMSFGLLADMANSGVSANGDDSEDGIRDGISAIGRLRLTLDVPVKEDSEDSKFGQGDVHARLIAAFGRMSPTQASQNAAAPFGSFSSYSRIAGDASNDNEGFGAGSAFNGLINGGSNLRANLYVESMYYQQHVKDGVPLLTDWMFDGEDADEWNTTADLYAGLIPWRNLFDKSPYRGNELTQFQNSSFVNTPGIAVNQNAPMVAYALHQQLGADDLSMDVVTGVGMFNSWDAMDLFALTYEGRVNYALADLPGSFYAGGYHAWSMGNSGAGNQFLTGGAGSPFAAPTSRAGGRNALVDGGDSLNALYVGWNQEWFEGVGTTFNYTLADNKTNNLILNSLNQTSGAYNAMAAAGVGVSVRQALSGVLNVPMSAFGLRENDVFGVGYALIDLQQNAELNGEFDSAWEHAVEAYYKYAVNDSVSIVPSIQLIVNRLGMDENGVTTVLGLRTNYLF